MAITGVKASALVPFTSQFEQAMADSLGMSDASGVTVQFTDTVDGVQIAWTFDASYASVVSQSSFQSTLLANLNSYAGIDAALSGQVTSKKRKNIKFLRNRYGIRRVEKDTKKKNQNLLFSSEVCLNARI